MLLWGNLSLPDHQMYAQIPAKVASRYELVKTASYLGDLLSSVMVTDDWPGYELGQLEVLIALA